MQVENEVAMEVMLWSALGTILAAIVIWLAPRAWRQSVVNALKLGKGTQNVVSDRIFRPWAEKERKRKIEHAEIAFDRPVPVRRMGSNPVVVEYSDGSRSFFFRDPETYKRELSAGRYPPRRSFFNKEPPEIV